jgi:glycosyltransferase involved in cell wall biosynthesis
MAGPSKRHRQLAILSLERSHVPSMVKGKQRMNKNKTAKILTLYYKHKPGGFCKRLRMKIEAYLDQGWTVHYIAVEPFPYQHHNLIPHIMPSPTDNHESLFFWAYFMLAAPLKVITVARQEKIDLFSVFSPLYAGLMAPAKRMFNIPLLMFIRSAPCGYYTNAKLNSLTLKVQCFLESSGLKSATKSYANSEAIKKLFLQEYGALARKIDILINHIEIKSFDRDQKRKGVMKEFGFEENDFVIATSGILIKSKSFDFLIQAIAETKLKQISLLIIGQGKEMESLEKLADQLGIGSQVHFTGWRRNVIPLLQGSDLFVFPSAQEGMSNSLLEALGCDLPCLVSSTPENREVLVNTDLMFDLKSTTNLVQKITRLVQDPDYYAKVQRICRGESRKFLFNWSEEIVKNAENLLTAE